MYRFNKLEKLLDLLVEDYKIETTDYSLRFINAGASFSLSRLDDSSDIAFDCVINEKYNSAFMFDFPAIHINNFLMKYLGNSDTEQHFLLRYPTSVQPMEIDDIYDILYQQMNNSPKFKTVFLPTILKLELPNNELVENTKRLKI